MLHEPAPGLLPWLLTLIFTAGMLTIGLSIIWRSMTGRSPGHYARARGHGLETAPVRRQALTQEQQDAQARAEVRAARQARRERREQVRKRRRAARAHAYQEALRSQELLRREAALERAESLRRREEDACRREEALAAARTPAAMHVIDLSSWGIGRATQPLIDGQDLEPPTPPDLPHEPSRRGW